MPAAVANYAALPRWWDRWALGRFVVPAAAWANSSRPPIDSCPAPRPDGEPLATRWPPRRRPEARLEQLGEFNCRHAADRRRAVTADVDRGQGGLRRAVASHRCRRMPGYLPAYVEVPTERDPLRARRRDGRGGRAKIRTGGVTADAFPSAGDVVRFIRGLRRGRRAVQGDRRPAPPDSARLPLTYAPDSPRGTMFGFLNVFLARVLAAQGMSDGDAEALLEERSAESLRVRRCDRVAGTAPRMPETIAGRRGPTIISFGSCSFTEPIGDLHALGLL